MIYLWIRRVHRFCLKTQLFDSRDQSRIDWHLEVPSTFLFMPLASLFLSKSVACLSIPHHHLLQPVTPYLSFWNFLCLSHFVSTIHQEQFSKREVLAMHFGCRIGIPNLPLHHHPYSSSILEFYYHSSTNLIDPCKVFQMVLSDSTFRWTRPFLTLTSWNP